MRWAVTRLVGPGWGLDECVNAPCQVVVVVVVMLGVMLAVVLVLVEESTRASPQIPLTTLRTHTSGFLSGTRTAAHTLRTCISVCDVVFVCGCGYVCLCGCVCDGPQSWLVLAADRRTAPREIPPLHCLALQTPSRGVVFPH